MEHNDLLTDAIEHSRKEGGVRLDSHDPASSDRILLHAVPTSARPGRRPRPEAGPRRAGLARLLYDAALQRTSWAVALVELVGLFQGSGGYLVLRREADGLPAQVVGGWAFAPSRDGRSGNLFQAAAVPHADAGPTGAGWTAAALRAIDAGAGAAPLTTAVRRRIAMEDGLVAELAVRRPQALGPLGPRERRLGAWLDIHLPEALSLYVGLRRLHADNLLYRRVLDKMVRSVFLVDRAGRVLHANAAAARATTALDAVSVGDGVLRIGDARTQARVRRAVTAMEGADPAATTPVDFRVPLDGAPRPLLVRVHATGADGRAADVAPEAAAIVELRDLNAQPSLMADMLQSSFCLSRAEAEIALAVADGAAPKAIARERGVAPSTIRSQLLSIYRKCGLSRQGELAALVSRLATFGGFEERA